MEQDPNVPFRTLNALREKLDATLETVSQLEEQAFEISAQKEQLMRTLLPGHAP